MKNMEWKDGKTAPKDMNPFLADIGYPWVVIAVWNGNDDGYFVHADFNVGMYLGSFTDTYFETESFDVEIKRWMPLPELIMQT